MDVGYCLAFILQQQRGSETLRDRHGIGLLFGMFRSIDDVAADATAQQVVRQRQARARTCSTRRARRRAARPKSQTPRLTKAPMAPLTCINKAREYRLMSGISSFSTLSPSLAGLGDAPAHRQHAQTHREQG